ncbi:MAG: iron ABC transporter permease [Campylobacterales bacterium]|nr:iron ABC transporter permease [Campylobacterales bacterium]
MKHVSLFLSLALLCLAPLFGEISLDYRLIFESGSSDHTLFWDIRLPRVLTAFFTGSVLALAGLVFQSVFRNPLTTPFTLGVASGATLGTAVAIVFLGGIAIYQYLLGFAGAIVSVAILFILSRSLKSTQTHTLLLAGIAMSFFYSAALMVLFYLSDFTQSYSIVRFTMGSLGVFGMEYVIPVMAVSLLFVALVRSYRHDLKLLLTSFEFAYLGGIDPGRTAMALLLISSAAVAVCVSVTGPIGFVGLIIPHIIQMIYRRSADTLIMPTFFYGGVFLVFCDLIARNLGTASDIPIGVITSFIGGPFFIYIILKRKRTHG